MEARLQISAPLLRTHEKGFVVVGAMLITATVLAAVIMILFFQSATYTQLRTKAACMKRSTDHEKKMKRLLEKLLAMNPRALSLREQLAAAKERLAKAIESGVPAAIAAAEAHVILIEAQRVSLATKQNLIFAQASGSSALFQNQLRREITQELGPRANIQIIANTLAVNADAVDIAPQYFPRTNFLYEQRSGAVWSAPFQNYVRASQLFIKQKLVHLPVQNVWEGSCAISLEERRPREYFVTMTAAKSLLKL